MRIGSWLKNWPRRRNSSVASVAVPAQSERLEPRALLSGSALVVGTELNIHLDTNQNVRLSSFNGNVLLETSSNGGLLQPLASIGSVPASSIQSIVITRRLENSGRYFGKRMYGRCSQALESSIALRSSFS